PVCKGRRLELRLVGSEGDEETLFEWTGAAVDAMLQDFEPLFQELPDDRYRIYIILEDGTEQLVLDTLLQDHQPSEPLTSGELDRIRPPRIQPRKDADEADAGE